MTEKEMDSIYKIQNILMKELERLDDDKIIEKNEKEINRANSISQNANVYLKTINIQLRIMDAKHNLKNIKID